MTKILNHINTYADLTAYNNDKEKDYPNISYIQGSDEVKWNKYDPDHIVAVYNVTSTSEATKLLLNTRNISKMWIDGVEQPSVVDSYTFDTLGEHIVKIGLSNKTDSKGCSFRFCNNIISAIIPSNVSWVYSYCFAQCENFASIIIQNGVKYIDNNAFWLDTKLTNVTIPNSVTRIGKEVFNNCLGLTSITIPDSVTSIGDYAFSSCSGLTSVTIPDSVTSIGISAFGSCTGLTSIVVDSANTVYDSRDNCNAIINTSTNELIRGCKNTIIPNTVTSIGQDAFSGCNSLTSINIPDSVTSIGGYAFSQCEGLKNITIPDSVTSIGNGAFQNCSGLTSIDIPSSVTSIGNQAFLSCTSLTSITIKATTPPTLTSTNVFINTNNCPIYVPDVEAYSQATNWSSLADRLQPIPTE
jgi:hypothetical protein